MNWREFWREWGWLVIGGAVAVVILALTELFLETGQSGRVWLEMVHGIR